MTQQHAAACRCFTPEDACRWALGAYYAASRELDPPAGEPWIDPATGVAWSSPACFVENFVQHLTLRVYSEAMPKGPDEALSSC